MNKVPVRENLRFIGRYILPPILVVIAVFLVVIWGIPSSSLSLEVFTIIYWIFSAVSFLLNHQTKKWTDYVVNHHGLRRERNPIMRKMYATKNFRERKIGLIGMFAILLVFYIMGVNAQAVLPFLILPSLFLAVILYDFLNDFYWIRRLKKRKVVT